VISRALVYGVLTGLLTLVYAGVVAAAGLAVGHGVASYLAAAVVAVSFAPVRSRLARFADRWSRGTRNDPYGVVASLASRLETSDDTDDVLAATAEAVLQAFRADWVRVELESADGSSVVGETHRPGRPPNGAEPGEAIRLPLVHHGGRVGSVALFAADGLQLAAEDERLLADLLRQAGIAAHAVDVTARLQQARKRLVTTREEERRRMRRDLHDGLGPQLAAMTLKLDAIRNLLRRDPDAADRLVTGAKEDLATAVTDVRRLVHDLRPPALDELGLATALAQQVARFRRSGPAGLDVEVVLPDAIDGLSAAAEVATYRIVSEALTNIARHSDARWCRVALMLEEDLRVRVEDDGNGIAPGTSSGVGLMSMRERAAELGGTCRVSARTGGGTVVEARLPRQREVAA
jgi:signal transduction histidine kinase